MKALMIAAVLTPLLCAPSPAQEIAGGQAFASLLGEAPSAAVSAGLPKPPPPAVEISTDPKTDPAGAPPALEDNSGFEVGLDAHVHLDGPEHPGAAANMRAFVSSGLFRRAFILSPAYLVSEDAAPLPAAYPDRLAQKRAYDAAVADLVAGAPGRLRGLCGFDPSFAGAESLEATAACLGTPGMRGLKFRLASGVLLADTANYAAVRSALAAGGSSLRFVIAHLDTYENTRRNPSAADFGNWVRQDQGEIDAFLGLAREFPSVQFVLAHSAFGPRMLRYLGDRARRAGLRNVWTDTSHILPVFLNAPMTAGGEPDPDGFNRGMAEGWRALGLDRVLFGSDELAGAAENGSPVFESPRGFIEEKLGVTGNPYLTVEEKRAVLSGNGERFWAMTE